MRKKIKNIKGEKQMTDISEIVKKYNKPCKELDLNVVGMYQSFYQQHKNIEGSYSQYIGTNEYNLKMRQRHNWVIEKIEETINAKQMYKNNNGKFNKRK